MLGNLVDVFCPGLCSESQWDNPGDKAGSERNTAAPTFHSFFDTHPLSYSNLLEATQSDLYISDSDTFVLLNCKTCIILLLSLSAWNLPSFHSFAFYVICHNHFETFLLHCLPAGTVLQCVTPQISTSLWNTLHSIIKVGSVALYVV